MSLPLGRRTRLPLPAWSIAIGIALLFLGVVGYAKITNHWSTEVPQQVYQQLVPQANEQQHPMPGQ